MYRSLKRRGKTEFLAGVLLIAVLLSGCGGPTVSDGAPDEPSAPAEEPAAQNDAAIPAADNTNYLVEPAPADDEIDAALAEMYDTQEQACCDLDGETLKKEMAYAKAIVDAYNGGTCPASIEEEGKYLAAMYEKRDKVYCNNAWAKLISGLHSLYNLVGLEDVLDLMGQSCCLTLVEIFPYPPVPRIDYSSEMDDQIYYSVAKLLHEACCEYDHTGTSDGGHPRCSHLDEWFDQYAENANLAYQLQ